MGELVAERTWSVQGVTIDLPVRIRDAELAGAVFTARPAEVSALLAGTGLRPFLLAGRAVSLLMLVHYGEWVLGSYDEVGIGLLTRGPRGRLGLHVVDLPVTGELTREAGQDIWGLPKWLMRCELTFHGPTASVTVHDGDTFVLRTTLRAGRVKVPFPVRSRLRTWSKLDHGAQAGVLLRGAAPMTLHAPQLGRGTITVELGEHPMADRMAALGMTRRPLLTLHTTRLTGDLDAFDPVG
ncbi:MAG TPA: acetoacetate decarboxylase family protein [Actinophytocola sp.]|uniref:acetoacetate decarboxylase family protein n=1 Tax=Actinophytocola sp. TaxID=1872138 RepID=UPI002DBD764B|nr:acetoacetate decarboxylase family protein [Actinophytocola sp.]HEU5470997.1 acetoacetate decarboxylase family protein [Actinophytocola sp.]